MGLFSFFRKNIYKSETNSSLQTNRKRMNETWNYDLMDILIQARLGNSIKLNELVKKHSPFLVANENYTSLLVFRAFEVQLWQDERRVMNCKPQDENFQLGITITTSSESGGTQSNIYLPNNLSYTGLKIQNNTVKILFDDKILETNVTELFRKLFFWNEFTEQDVEIGFKNLCNEQYEEKEHIKPIVKDKVIQISTIDKLTYNEEYECYEGTFKDEERNIIDIKVHYTTPKKLEKLLKYIDEQIQSKFYKKMLLEIEAEMIGLKNDSWLGEHKETGEEEPAISVEEFRKRISVNSIIFNDDCSSLIYCNDDEFFWGHDIEITIDKNGKYKQTNLVG